MAGEARGGISPSSLKRAASAGSPRGEVDYIHLALKSISMLTLTDIKITELIKGSPKATSASGLVLTAFAIAHGLGNFHMLHGSDAYNAYGKFLRRLPGFTFIELWLGLATLMHVISGAMRALKVPMGSSAFDRRKILFLTGSLTLGYFAVHLPDFRFPISDAVKALPDVKIRPQWMPPFYTNDTSVDEEPVRDLTGTRDMVLFYGHPWHKWMYVVATAVVASHGLVALTPSYFMKLYAFYSNLKKLMLQ